MLVNEGGINGMLVAYGETKYGWLVKGGNEEHGASRMPRLLCGEKEPCEYVLTIDCPLGMFVC